MQDRLVPLSLIRSTRDITCALAQGSDGDIFPIGYLCGIDFRLARLPLSAQQRDIYGSFFGESLAHGPRCAPRGGGYRKK